MQTQGRKVDSFEHCEQPGDYYLTSDVNNTRRLSFLCPCGCNILGGIRVNNQGNMDNHCWSWNLDEYRPTCQPSINLNDGHWHGYLTDGVFHTHADIRP